MRSVADAEMTSDERQLLESIEGAKKYRDDPLARAVYAGLVAESLRKMAPQKREERVPSQIDGVGFVP
jgi:hypothetical protein